MKVLVTGGSGFIGRNLVARLARQGHEVTSLDRNDTPKDQRVRGIKYVCCDTKDIASIKNRFDVLYHMGEYSRISTSFEDIQNVWDSNVAGTFSVLQYCRKNNVRLIYGASSSKFGNGGDDENLSPYAWTKSKNVELIKNYGSWFDLQYSIVYFYNVYGPGQTSTGKYSTVIGIFENQYTNGLPLTVVSPGTQRRFFTHVDDVTNGLMELLDKGDNKEFCFGDVDSNYSVEEVAKMFTDNIVYVKSKQGDRMGSPMDTSSSEDVLGWKPAKKLSDYVQEFKNA
tara:strand:- start:3709 stop:4557 length:849 start_codon:yes stop_codon:yes gene_type:complete